MSTPESWKWCLGTILARCKDASQAPLTISGILYTLARLAIDGSVYFVVDA